MLQVDCTDAGTVVDATSIAASRRRAHLRFTNRTAVEQVIVFRSGGDGLQPGRARRSCRRCRREQEEVACALSEDLGPDLPRTRVDVVDPDGVFVPVPACAGTSSISDFAEGSEQVGDPVELTRPRGARRARRRLPARPAAPGLHRQRAGRLEPIGDGWVPTYRSRC